MSQINENIEDFESFDIRKVFKFLTDHWKWIAIGVLVSLLSGFIYIRYATPEYRSTAKVLIKNENDGGGLAGFQLEGFGFSPEGYGAESEAEILKSRQLLGKVVDELDLTTVVYTYGGFTKIKKTELFKMNSPVWLTQVNPDASYFKSFKISTRSNNEGDFTLKFENGETMPVSNGDTIVHNGVELLFTKAFGVKIKPSQLFEFNILSRDEAISSLIGAIGINKDQINEGILGISMKGSSSDKNNAVLNELIEQQQISAIDQKNLTAKKTNDFLSHRLVLIEQKLDSIENIGRAIKSKNDIIDIPSELPAMLNEERQLEEDYFELSVNEALAKQMIDFFESDSDFQSLIPVNLSFNSVPLNTSIGEYNQLVLERNNLLASSNENNPLVIKRKNDIVRLRSNLKKSVQSYLSSLLEQKNRVQKKLNQYTSKKSSLPKYELDYRDAMRDQKISESIYLMLLQKKEENEIVLASTESNIRVIDYAFSNGKPISPQKKKIYIISFLIGAIVPIGIIYLLTILNTKLTGVQEIESLKLPTIGEIPFDESMGDDFFKFNPHSPKVEAFRMLRTNLGFITDDSKPNVILVTSTISGEGKTYVTLNLASIIAKTGKKVVVLGMDLRVPKLMEYAGANYTVGLSNYLADNKDSISLRDITYPIRGQEGLSIIPSGSIPPNPSELLLSKKVTEIISKLKEDFDYLIIDSSPVGLVSDTLSISSFSDLVLYVSRVGYTQKKHLEIARLMHKEEKLKRMYMLVNGVDISSDANRYGYGYGYHADKKVLKWYHRLLPKLFKGN